MLLLLLGCQPALPPNIVYIVADDQRWDTLWAMPAVQQRLVPEGLVFEEAFTTAPMCCPSRAGVLSGGRQPWNTGVYGNILPSGGADVFDDTDTLATRLKGAGYHTALIGKYLNQYEDIAPWMPPGWDIFSAILEWNGVYDWSLVVGSTPHSARMGDIVEGGNYLTDALADRALLGLDLPEPFFLYVAPYAPHLPNEAAPQDAEMFADYQYRGRSYYEADLSDKPSWILEKVGRSEAELDADIRVQLQSLQAIDRMVGAILDGLEERGLKERTLIVYVGDNGYLWGEHGLTWKGLAYEESLRVPLVVAGPGVQAGTERSLVAANLDLPATFLALAGAHMPTDGHDLRPTFAGGDVLRERLLFSYYDAQDPPWAAVRTQDWKVVTHGTGDVEIYDLAADPFEMENLADQPPSDAQALLSWLESERATVLLTRELPDGAVGAPYEASLAAWSGRGALSFTASSLPEGLTLDGDRITGVPSAPGTVTATITVADQDRAFSRNIPITIGEAARLMRASRQPGPDGTRLQLQSDTTAQIEVFYGVDLTDARWPARQVGEGSYLIPPGAWTIEVHVDGRRALHTRLDALPTR